MPFKPAHGAHYYLVAAHSGKVLEVKDASNGNGAIIQTADPKPFKSSDHQQWAFNRNADRIWVRAQSLRVQHVRTTGLELWR